MPLYNFFKNIFGIRAGDNSQDSNNQRSNDFDQFFYNDPRNHNHEEYDDYGDERQHPEGTFSFNVFTDPIEIHRYFEQQMDDMMKSFQNLFKSDDNDFGGSIKMFPPMQEHPQIEPNKENLRDHYLKPGYQYLPDASESKREDSDLDGKIDIGSLDSIFKGPQTRQQIVPHQPQVRSSFFGQSMTTRRIQKADGSVEIHKTTRDHEGNEETTVTRQMGDKQYIMTTRRNKDGQEEKIENFVNIDDANISQFMNFWEQPSQNPPDDPNKYFPFDKFFK